MTDNTIRKALFLAASPDQVWDGHLAQMRTGHRNAPSVTTGRLNPSPLPKDPSHPMSGG